MSVLRRTAVSLALAALVVASVAASASGRGEARWVIRDLGTLGGRQSEAVAVSERGTVVGWAWTQDFYPHAFVWRDGRLSDLGTLPGAGGRGRFSISRPTAVNGHDQVVGYNQEDENGPGSQGFLWIEGKTSLLSPGEYDDTMPSAINGRGQVVGWHGNALGFAVGVAALWRNGTVVELGTLPGLPQSWAVAINERGQVVVNSFSSTEGGADPTLFRIRSFLWQNGRRTDLGSLRGRPRTWAVAINDRGQIAGNSYVGYGSAPVGVRAFLWQEGRMLDLGTLGGRESSVMGAKWATVGNFAPFSPDAINASGQVVGWSTTAHDAQHGFVWRSGSMVDLGVLPGDLASEATALNARGQVIGSSYARRTKFGEYEGSRPFVWQDGRMTDLGTLPGGNESSAVDINDRGQIVGWATTKTGERHAVLWTKTGS